MDKKSFEFYSGCLLGGAIGDALGAPVEFLSLENILRQHGKSGVTGFLPAFGKMGSVTDDTQMTLFTAEGLLRNQSQRIQKGSDTLRNSVHSAYMRWLLTQAEDSEHTSFKKASQSEKNGWLIKTRALHARRAPGNTCISALRDAQIGSIENPINSSKGCGGVMRMAPVGLFIREPEAAFKVGCELAAITHGHPNGYLPAGFFASIICTIINGLTLRQSLQASLEILKSWKMNEQCLDIFNRAILIGTLRPKSAFEVEGFGAGWVGEEALAIAIYSALSYEDNPDFSSGVLLAVNHSGDSDSTGSITGNILGALLGRTAIPAQWLEAVELRQEIEQISRDLLAGYQATTEWRQKYPA